MAVIMKRGRRPRRPDPIRNRYVDDRGRTYRICFYNQRPIIVALRGKKRERLLDIDGRRARQIISISKEGNRDETHA